jgi:ubiquinone/menaquinone biosynthesis C-methylase UbiE
MESEEYELMAAAEDHMWWFSGLHEWMLDRIQDLSLPAGATVLDCGAGTGGFARKLSSRFPALPVVAVDLDANAIRYFRQKSVHPVVQGSVNDLAFSDDCFDAVVSSDLLYHNAVDERRALRELYRTMRPGAHLLLNLPAYNWMKSTHDEKVHTARRYTARGIAETLTRAGFHVEEAGYRNSLLFPVMALWRLTLGRFSAESDVTEFPAWQEFLFSKAMGVENTLARHRVRFPFGGSVYAHAVKPRASA